MLAKNEALSLGIWCDIVDLLPYRCKSIELGPGILQNHKAQPNIPHSIVVMIKGGGGNQEDYSDFLEERVG